MIQIANSKQYDLEERTFQFSKQIIEFIKQIPKNLINVEIVKQLVKSGCSVGANYIEANETLGRKDFALRIKICKKEAKETRYWLKLINLDSETTNEIRNKLIQEATELMKIFGAILEKTKSRLNGLFSVAGEKQKGVGE